MKNLHHLFAVLTLLGVNTLSMSSVADDSQLLVVTDVKNIDKLSKNQIRQIYLEGGIQLPVKPLGFKSGDKFRSIFNTKIIGLTESRIESYWAQMKFTGRASPPKEFAKVEDLLGFLQNNSGFIAYLPSDIEVPDSLNVVYVLNY